MIERPILGEETGLINKDYLDLTPDGDFFENLAGNTEYAISFFSQIPESKVDYAYAEGKWTIKQVLQHICDVERVMAFRAFVASRTTDSTPLPGMNEEEYAENIEVSKKSMAELIEEFEVVRVNAFCVLKSITADQSKRTVSVHGHQVSARTFAFMLPGHVLHHINIIRDRYL